MKHLLAATGLATILAVSALSAQAETTLKMAHAAPEADLQQDLSVFFKEQVEERSNGEIKVNIFPHGQLGSDSQMIDGVRSGVIDIVMSGLNNFTGLLPEAGAFTLPFMFPDRETAYKVLDGDVGQGLSVSMDSSASWASATPKTATATSPTTAAPSRCRPISTVCGCA